METVRLLVRNLVFLVIMAAFLEMLLPLQGTRRIVQATIGLFILLAVLGPIVTLLRQQSPLHITLPSPNQPLDGYPTGWAPGGQPAGQGGNSGLSSILEQGQALQQVTSTQEQEAYVQRMDDQIAVICRLVPGVKAASASVTLDPSAPQQSLGAIRKVNVELQLDEEQAAGSPTRRVPAKRVGYPGAVENVQIGAGRTENTPSLSEGAIAAQVQETVGSLFGLQDDQVAVTFNKTLSNTTPNNTGNTGPGNTTPNNTTPR